MWALGSIKSLNPVAGYFYKEYFILLMCWKCCVYFLLSFQCSLAQPRPLFSHTVCVPHGRFFLNRSVTKMLGISSCTGHWWGHFFHTAWQPKDAVTCWNWLKPWCVKTTCHRLNIYKNSLFYLLSLINTVYVIIFDVWFSFKLRSTVLISR